MSEGPIIDCRCAGADCHALLFSVDAGGFCTLVMHLEPNTDKPQRRPRSALAGAERRSPSHAPKTIRLPWPHEGPLDEAQPIPVVCPNHGRWDVDTPAVLAEIRTGKANHKRRLKLWVQPNSKRPTPRHR